MEILRFLESIRTPVLDEFFSFITHFGEETIFIIIGFFLFWCVSKKSGYYVLFVGFTGLVLNQFLKITFRIPRPWIKDSTFSIVESARAEATGYSFPSGHTQISVGAYGSIGRACKKLAIRIICVVLCLLVPVSRLYLGVHTPADVGVSVLLALILVFGLYPIINRIFENKNAMRFFMAIMTLISFCYLLYVEMFNFPLDIDVVNYAGAVENAYKILGSMLGVWLGYELDVRFMKFDTKAVWWAQILKLATGLIPVLIIKSLLKQPLNMICGGSGIAGSIRYFLITSFACGIWPFTFKYFGRLGKKN